MPNPYRPHVVEIVDLVPESPTIFTLRLKFCDPAIHAEYVFAPGQFNMLYLYGVGEIPISIVSDPEDDRLFDHAIRRVGRVTGALAQLKTGAQLGIRGPYGRGWPLCEAEGKDVVIVTGGLGCAPTVSVINYVIRRRERYGRLVIMQGVKHSDDLIWRAHYDRWRDSPDTQVFVAADAGTALWPWHVGRVTDFFEQAQFDPANSVIMMCGPQGMMQVAVEQLLRRNVPEDAVWLSLERSMHCAVGHCGHCQFGGKFVCKDGPVFNYPEVKELFGVKGF